MAPEVLHKHYGPECDVWSAGVILYILLCGFPPFWAGRFQIPSFFKNATFPSNAYSLMCPTLCPESEIGIFRKILQGKLDFEINPWPSISESAKDLIKKMLESNPKKRLTAHQVLCKLSCP